MFNPYVPGCGDGLEPLPPPEHHPAPSAGPQALSGLLGRLEHLDREDLLLGVLVYLLARDREDDSLWPLVAAALYFLL